MTAAAEPLDPDRFNGMHRSEPDPRDPEFCRCGFALTAYRHVDSRHYVSRPLTRDVWRELRGGTEGGGA